MIELRSYRKVFAAALSFAFLSACGQTATAPPEPLEPALTFDGAAATESGAQIAHGQRLADLLGCTGCHQPDFSGGPFNEGWIAPNVALLAANYDAASLDRAIRQGIALDGRKLRLMPSEMYRSLSDADMQALAAFLLALSPTGEVQPAFKPFPSDLAIWEVDGYIDANTLGRTWAAEGGPLALGDTHARGRYLAMNLCTECHNGQLQGYPDFTPDLMIVTAYADADLKRLLHEGKGNVRDQLGLMSLVAPSRFPYLTNQEYDDLTAYLRARAGAMLDE